MNPDSIPVFKPYQALTADHLNDLREFLDHADRSTRRTLVGIGVLCGFHLDVDASGRVLVSKGVAVTSEGWLIAEEAVACDRVRPYEVPVPTGDDVLPEQAAEARYPYLFPDGESQIDAWELLTTEVVVPDGEPAPDPVTEAFLSDKTVMLFLECTESSLKNCDINDCSDRGAELQFVLRRLLVRRADADAMMAEEARIAGFPTDRATHPGLALPFLRIDDLGIARERIGTYPALFARILQIASRLGTIVDALRGAYEAYRHLLSDMYPPDRFPGGPFPDGAFGNVTGNFLAQPYLAPYAYDLLLDLASAYNEFVAAARRFDAECLPDADRFAKHVLLGDPVRAPLGFVAELDGAAAFAAYDPLSASTGFGPRPAPPRRRTPWTPADAGCRLEEVRALFHRLALLPHAFQLRGLLAEELRVTPSRHDDAALGERCIPPYYAFTRQSDLFRVWSPAKTRANLLSTVYAHRFSTRDADHPYLFRIDGETFHAVAGHVGKDLARAIAELTETRRVLGLDFAIRPVWMGLALASDANGARLDAQARERAFRAATRLILCRMGDFEVILLALLAALFAFLVYILRGVGRQRTLDHANLPQRITAGVAPTPGPAEAAPAGRALADEDMARLSAMLRVDAVRKPDALGFSALRLGQDERLELKGTSKVLLDRYRTAPAAKGDATRTLLPQAADADVAAFYLAVKDDGDGNLFDRVRERAATLDIPAGQTGATDRIYNAVALMDATETLMASASARDLAAFDFDRFEADYADFSVKLSNYAATAPADPADVDTQTATTNLAVSDYAPAVAAQTTALSGAGLLGEAQRRMRAIFEDLTLAGMAKRHPGLEHRAGVPKGGTLVLAYAAKAELQALMAAAAPSLDRLSSALKVGGGLGAAIAAATAEVLQAAGPSGDDPLSDFVVLADFCLDSKCCDDDCADVIPEEALPRDLFDLRGAGRAAVPPVIPNGLPSDAPGAVVSIAAGDIRALLDGIGVGSDRLVRSGGVPVQPPVQPPVPPPVSRPVERPVAPGDTITPPAEQPVERPLERPVAPGGAVTPPAQPTVDPPPERPAERPVAPGGRVTPPSQPTVEPPAGRPVERPVRPGGGVTARASTGSVSGRVLGLGGASRTVITEAEVSATHAESGRTTALETRRGAYQGKLPAGKYVLVAEAPGMTGVERDVEIAAGGSATVDLRMRRAR